MLHIFRYLGFLNKHSVHKTSSLPTIIIIGCLKGENHVCHRGSKDIYSEHEQRQLRNKVYKAAFAYAKCWKGADRPLSLKEILEHLGGKKI